jgi:hypothetical protein
LYIDMLLERETILKQEERKCRVIYKMKEDKLERNHSQLILLDLKGLSCERTPLLPRFM